MDRDREQARRMWAELTFQKKWEYFWSYYKVHVWGGVFLAMLVGLTVHDCVTRVDPDFTISYVGTELSTEALTQIGTDLSAVIEDSNGDGRAVVFVTQVVDEQKLYVTFAAGDIHLLLIRQEEFLRYANNGAFRPFEPVLDELALTLNLREYPEIRLTPQDEHEAHIYGIPLEQNALFAAFGATMTDTYLALPVRGMFSSEQKEQTRRSNTLALVKTILAQSAQAK